VIYEKERFSDFLTGLLSRLFYRIYSSGAAPFRNDTRPMGRGGHPIDGRLTLMNASDAAFKAEAAQNQASSVTSLNGRDPAEIAERIVSSVATVIRGKDDVVRLLLTALFARGHVLVEDVPGVGKTTLARALAACLSGTFRRIQFTSDLLPSDILGVSIYDQRSNNFEFKPGPIFANVVLADEINRTTPRTQSSLMEALNEGHITVDNQTHVLQDPFILLATQNPLEHFGTYPLPESELDRFFLRLAVGYPDEEIERQVIAERGGYDPLHTLEPVVSKEEICAVQKQVDAVLVDPALLDYVMDIVAETRASPMLSLGVSTRGAISWYRAAQAHALVHGRNYCEPDDFKNLASHALAHRIVLAGQQDSSGPRRVDAEHVLSEILDRIPIPL
jgi:MoxR-like ATPase